MTFFTNCIMVSFEIEYYRFVIWVSNWPDSYKKMKLSKIKQLKTH